MNVQVDNPTFVDDEGKSKRGFSIELREEKQKQTNGVKKDEKDVEYDPYLHRVVKHPTTNADTFFHLLKGSMGTGILSMPLAFYHAGYLVGVICTIVIGAICTYCLNMIIQSEYELCKRKKIPCLTYPATAKAALFEGPPFFKKCAPYAPVIVNTFLIVYQMGSCCVYTVFISENIKHVADDYMGRPLSLEIWMTIILLPLILINYIRNLKFLAPFSTAANLITIVSFGIVLYYLIRADMTFEGRNPAGDVANFPLYFGTVLFALEAVGVIMPLENEMKTPKAFKGPCGILNVGMVFIVCLYVAMGLLGFLAFGPNVRETVTLNLTRHEVPAQVVKIMLAIAIFITHALQLYVAIDIVWNEYLGPKFKTNRYKIFFEYVVRTVLVLITFGLAVAIPKLDLFISLFGCLCLSMLGLAFPAILETSTFWYSLTGVRGYLIIFKNLCLVLFGLIGLVAGTYTSLAKIVEYFQDR